MCIFILACVCVFAQIAQTNEQQTKLYTYLHTYMTALPHRHKIDYLKEWNAVNMISICMHNYIYTYIHIYIWVTYPGIHIYIYICVCVCIYMYIHMYRYACMHKVYVYMCVYIHIYIYNVLVTYVVSSPQRDPCLIQVLSIWQREVRSPRIQGFGEILEFVHCRVKSQYACVSMCIRTYV